MGEDEFFKLLYLSDVLVRGLLVEAWVDKFSDLFVFLPILSALPAVKDSPEPSEVVSCLPFPICTLELVM